MRKSLSRAVGSKAQDKLGISANSKTHVLQVQRSGWLMKKPFLGGTGPKKGQWQRRFFILKDSFLFWYSNKPSASFDVNPNGCLPLGGCSVFPMGREKDGGFVFEVSHPDFNGNVLQLKSTDKNEVDDWIKVLQDCSKATWENAMLGDALIQKLKHSGTTTEREKEKALEEAQKNAEEMATTREEKRKLMERQLAQQRKFEEELLKEKERAKALESEMRSEEQQLERERREQEEEKERMKELEMKLDEAIKGIEQLEAAVERRQRTDLPGMEPSAELREHIETIKEFMNTRFGGAGVNDD